MPRQRSPERDKAFEIYKKHQGNIELIKIAEQLSLPEGTVRGWKNKDKWDEQIGTNGTERSKQIRNVPKKEKNVPKVPKKTEIKFKDIDDELTEKQRLFCLYYVKYWNAGKAAEKAGYECSYPNGYYEIGSQLLKKSQVKKEIKRLKKLLFSDIYLEAQAVLQKYIDIAFADITDFVSFGQKEVQVMGPFGPVYEGKGDDKKPVTKIVNFVDLKDSNAVDGTIITEVSQGRDGVKIKLADKMKALEKLEGYFDLFPDKFKRWIEEEKLRLEEQRLKMSANEESKETITEHARRVQEVWEKRLQGKG